MNERKKHQLQQNAFMWFKSRYGKNPKEYGLPFAVSRIKRVCFFKRPQVVFAPEKEVADAFVKGQKIMDRIVCAVFVILLLMACLMFYFFFLLGQDKTDQALITGMIIVFFGVLMIIALIVCYAKIAPLQKLYKRKVAVYTA